MSRAAGTVFPLGARVFRPAAAEGGGKLPPAKPATLLLPASAASRLRPAGGSEDPRTQRAAVAAAFLLLLGLAACSPPPDDVTSGVETTALWLFDEPAGLYPSHTLDDMSDNDMVLTLGLGAQVAPGRYGNALLLAPLDPPLDVPPAEEKPGEFGLARLPTPEGRTVEPLSWFTAHFAALMTSGENHLRKQVGHKNPATSALNLGDFDWTVEFWHSPGDAAFGGSRPEGRRTDTPPAAEASSAAEAIVFEIGTGPRGENDIVTQLRWSADRAHFVLINQPAGASIDIPTAAPADATTTWHHYAFTYDATTDQLRHYVDGTRQPQPPPTTLAALPEGEEAYFTLGTDALWNHRLTGLLDEFRVSRGLVYTADFDPPATFATTPEPVELTQGPPLLFAGSASDSTEGSASATAGASTDDLTDTDAASDTPLHLATRKHLFIDDALLATTGDATFAVNPPRRAERVIDNIKGTFRKHLTVASGDDGVIRIYNSREEDHLAIYTSTDGVHFDRPDQGRGEINGHRNIVIPDMVGGLGNPFWDPQAPPDERWKYLTDYQRRGLYLYTSADGYNWTRRRNIVLPFRSGTQSSTYYDDQRQVYMSYHRSGIFHTPGGVTQRSSVVTEHEDLRATQPFQPLTQQEYLDLRAEYPLRDPLPWWVDNGPLTPGGFGMEYPHLFDPTPEDPVGTDFYLTKAMKYPYAPDTYLAFPVGYFHYYGDGPEARTVLGLEERGLGSGPLESQIAVSRNGLDWKRHPEPAYVGIGRHQGRDVVTAYIGHGMIRRGEELWQYYFGETHYHSPHTQDPDGRGVYRLVQRLDGFISLDSPYGHETTVVTRPLTFEGDRLQLNVDTDAVGYLQVGFLDEQGQPIEDYTVDDCVYVNGDFIAKEVDWLTTGADVSPLAGRTVQVVFRMRGAKLYAMQFVEGG
ncbi:MAG: LamG domain-containing protein [Holophagales bacterium]|nr:LamG domain-containing protein [Holophagales bacterium]MYI81308.1 LamG domain-containing protein [Holophagales bacterium]